MTGFNYLYFILSGGFLRFKKETLNVLNKSSVFWNQNRALNGPYSFVIAFGVDGGISFSYEMQKADICKGDLVLANYKIGWVRYINSEGRCESYSDIQERNYRDPDVEFIEFEKDKKVFRFNVEQWVLLNNCLSSGYYEHFGEKYLNKRRVLYPITKEELFDKVLTKEPWSIIRDNILVLLITKVRDDRSWSLYLSYLGLAFNLNTNTKISLILNVFILIVEFYRDYASALYSRITILFCFFVKLFICKVSTRGKKGFKVLDFLSNFSDKWNYCDKELGVSSKRKYLINPTGEITGLLEIPIMSLVDASWAQLCEIVESGGKFSFSPTDRGVDYSYHEGIGYCIWYRRSDGGTADWVNLDVHPDERFLRLKTAFAWSLYACEISYLKNSFIHNPYKHENETNWKGTVWVRDSLKGFIALGSIDSLYLVIMLDKVFSNFPNEFIAILADYTMMSLNKILKNLGEEETGEKLKEFSVSLTKLMISKVTSNLHDPYSNSGWKKYTYVVSELMMKYSTKKGNKKERLYRITPRPLNFEDREILSGKSEKTLELVKNIRGEDGNTKLMNDKIKSLGEALEEKVISKVGGLDHFNAAFETISFVNTLIKRSDLVVTEDRDVSDYLNCYNFKLSKKTDNSESEMKKWYSEPKNYKAALNSGKLGKESVFLTSLRIDYLAKAAYEELKDNDNPEPPQPEINERYRKRLTENIIKYEKRLVDRPEMRKMELETTISEINNSKCRLNEKFNVIVNKEDKERPIFKMNDEVDKKVEEFWDKNEEIDMEKMNNFFPCKKTSRNISEIFKPRITEISNRFNPLLILDSLDEVQEKVVDLKSWKLIEMVFKSGMSINRFCKGYAEKKKDRKKGRGRKRNAIKAKIREVTHNKVVAKKECHKVIERSVELKHFDLSGSGSLFKSKNLRRALTLIKRKRENQKSELIRFRENVKDGLVEIIDGEVIRVNVTLNNSRTSHEVKTNGITIRLSKNR